MKRDLETHIRSASENDFNELYSLGQNTPELRVSAGEAFMSKEEFKWAIQNGVFVVAEYGGKLAGFAYAHPKDAERPFREKYACLVYLAVLPEYRNKGIATELHKERVKRLKDLGITHAYALANPTSGIIDFLKKQGFKEGHKIVWMDGEL